MPIILLEIRDFIFSVPADTLLVFILVLFCAGIMRGIFGFGDGLLVIPVMMNFLEVNTIIAVMVIFELFMIVNLVGLKFNEVDRKLQMGLLKWAVLGIPVGLLFLKISPEKWLKIGFGPVVLVFAFVGLTPIFQKVKINKLTEAIFGLLSGILAGAYNANGPAVVTYVSLFNFPPQKFVINLQTHFLVTTLFLLVGHFFNGFWSERVLVFLIVGFFPLFISLTLGKFLRNKIHPERYSRLAFQLLLITAVVSVFKSI